MAGFRQKRHYNKNPQRRKVPGVGAEAQLTRRTPIVPETVGPNSSNAIAIVFDGPCSLNEGILPLLTCGAFACNGASQTSPNTITFLFAGLGPFTGDVRIPFEDPSVRNQAGGYMQPGLYVQAE